MVWLLRAARKHLWSDTQIIQGQFPPLLLFILDFETRRVLIPNTLIVDILGLKEKKNTWKQGGEGRGWRREMKHWSGFDRVWELPPAISRQTLPKQRQTHSPSSTDYVKKEGEKKEDGCKKEKKLKRKSEGGKKGNKLYVPSNLWCCKEISFCINDCIWVGAFPTYLLSKSLSPRWRRIPVDKSIITVWIQGDSSATKFILHL